MEVAPIQIPDPDNIEMHYLLQLIQETKRNIFLTGRAGTGKSTLLRYVSSHTSKEHVILAPTGISALNAGGQTIHSFFRLPFSPIPPTDKELLRNSLKKIRKEQRKLINKLELIIIDEVSMVRADVIDAIDYLLRVIRGLMSVPFGGVQMLFVGDLFQLEPVVTRGEMDIISRFYKTSFFYGAVAFDTEQPLLIELSKVYRQTDKEFVSILDRIRTGVTTNEDVALLNGRSTNQTTKEPHSTEFNITLTSRRDRAMAINEEALEQLNTEEERFQGSIVGEFPESTLPTDLSLSLKRGAQIMFIANDPNHEWVNGSLGRYLGSNEEFGFLEIELEDGRECQVEPYTWENKRYTLDETNNSIEEEVIGKFTQYPLRLAWAITIHKSQGLTFDNATIDFSDGTFAAGQAYVALSRCRTLEGMKLVRPFQKHDVITRPAIIEYYRSVANPEQLKSSLKTSRANALYQSAISLLNKGNLYQAITRFGEALKEENIFDNPRAQRLLLHKLYQVESVIAQQKKRSSQTSKSKKQIEQLCQEYIEMGDQCIHEYDDATSAIKNYDKALALDPLQPTAIAHKAFTLRSTGHIQEALQLLQEAYKKLFRNLEIAVQFALTHLELGSDREAYKILSRAATEYPTNRILLQQLVDLAKRLDYKDEMRRYQILLKKSDEEC